MRLSARGQNARELFTFVADGLVNERNRHLYQLLCAYSSRRWNGRALGRSGRIWRQIRTEIGGQVPQRSVYERYMVCECFEY